MRGRLKWLRRIVAAVTLTALLIAGGLMTSTGQQLLILAIESAAATGDRRVEIGTLQGSLFSDGRIDRITVSDRRGVWLEIHDAAFSWNPLALVSGQIEIAHVLVGLAKVMRRPLSSPADSSTDLKFDIPLIAITADKIEVTEVALGEPLLGTPVSLRIEGSADIVERRRGLSATIKVTRTDVPGGAVSAHLSYKPEGKELTVLASAKEPAGGLMARYLELPGLPPVAFEADGRGSIDQWRLQWSLAASGQPFVAGSASIDRNDDQHHFKTNFEGYLSPILPPFLEPLFNGKTIASLNGSWNNTGRFKAKTLSIKSNTLDLNASGGFDFARSYVHGGAMLSVGRADGEPVSLPFPDGSRLALSHLRGAINIPDVRGMRRISTEVSVANLASPWGELGKADLIGSAEQEVPVGPTAFSADTAVVTLQLREIAPRDRKLLSVFGPSVNVRLQGRGSPQSAAIDSFILEAASMRLAGSGTWEDGIVSLIADVVAADLSKFSDMAGRSLIGSTAVKLKVSLPLNAWAIKVAVEGTAIDVGVDGGNTATILNGETKFSGVGQWVRSRTLEVEHAQISNRKLYVRGNGKFGSDRISADLEAKLQEISLVSPSLRGALLIAGKVDGKIGELRSSVRVSGEDVTVKGKPVSDLQATFNGSGPATDHRGRLALDGSIDGREIKGSGLLSVAESGAFSIKDLNLAFASAQLAGNLRKGEGGPILGRLQLSVPKLADFTVLSDEAIAGSISAWAEMAGTSERPELSFEVKSDRAEIARFKVRALKATAKLANYITAIEGRADVRIEKVESEGFIARDLRAEVRETENGLKFDASGHVNEARAMLRGDMIQRGASYLIGLADARLSKADTSIKLDGLAEIAISNGAVEFKTFAVLVAEGRAVVSGTVNPQNLALKITLSRVPAAVAKAFRDDLGLGGVLDGSIATTGTLARPVTSLSLDWRDASAAVTRDARLPPLAVSLRADLRGDVFENRITVSGPDGLNVLVYGNGRLAQPLTTRQRVTGEVPLAFSNSALATRGTRFTGKAVIDSVVTVGAAQPQLSGTVTISDGSLSDPASGLRLNDMNGLARLAGGRIVVEQMHGKSERGGTISLTGSFEGLLKGELKTNIALHLAGVQFNDKELLAGEIDGDLALRGPVSGLKASGSIYIKRLDVTVPNRLPRSIAALDLKHVNVPRYLRSDPAARDKEKGSGGGPGGIGLNIAIKAADRIFVRGRGLNAQLGGALRIQGESDRPVANGSIDLVSGRLSILGRQLDFNRGNIYFNDSLDAFVELEASAVADGVTAQVAVYGPLSRLLFRFSSIPELPEDEVVAKLLFNKSLVKLSPLQIAQLANEVDKIGGLSSGPSILDQLKSSVGVDVLDFGTDKSGSATVSAGSYLNEQTYVGVQQGTTTSSSRVVIDHDLTKTLKARGEVGADGNSKIGIGFEWDY